MNFLVYRNDTGRITATGVCSPVDFEGQAGEGYTVFLADGTEDIRKDYVKDGRVVPRPEFSITVDGRVISGIPEGTRLVIEDQSFQVDDGVAEISDNVSKCTLSLWPFLDKVIFVED